LKRSSSPSPSLSVDVERSNGRITGIVVRGHAGFANRGRDIVCAGASALVLSAAHGIVAHCGARAHVIDDGGGDYRVDVPLGGNTRAQAVLESAVSGLRAISRSYPGSLRVRSAAGKPAAAPKRTAPARVSRRS
jgi:uncharacterized protein